MPRFDNTVCLSVFGECLIETLLFALFCFLFKTWWGYFVCYEYIYSFGSLLESNHGSIKSFELNYCLFVLYLCRPLQHVTWLHILTPSIADVAWCRRCIHFVATCCTCTTALVGTFTALPLCLVLAAFVFEFSSVRK